MAEQFVRVDLTDHRGTAVFLLGDREKMRRLANDLLAEISWLDEHPGEDAVRRLEDRERYPRVY